MILVIYSVSDKFTRTAMVNVTAFNGSSKDTRVMARNHKTKKKKIRRFLYIGGITVLTFFFPSLR